MMSVSHCAPEISSPSRQLSSAAVLAALHDRRDGCGPRVWLTVRAAGMRTHAGEPCLPGGRVEACDAGAVECALREAREEVGLASADVDAAPPPLLLPAAEMVSAHGVRVEVAVAWVSRDFCPRPQPSEVQCAFSVPLRTFLEPAAHWSADVDFPSRPAAGEAKSVSVRVHWFDCGEHVVWGLTAAVLIVVAQSVLGSRPSFDVGPLPRPAHVLPESDSPPICASKL
jgi:coenzyme A diphosphatase NUDT7